MSEKNPDPRVVFALIFFFSTYGILIRQDLAAMVVLLILSILCAAVLKVQLRRIFGRLKRLLQILLLVTILRSFFTPSGIVLLSAWDVPLLTTGGLAMGFLVSFRLIIFIVSAAMLTVYPARALIQAMAQMKMPFEMAYMVSIGLRFVPQFAEEMQDSLTALQLRGVVIEEIKLRKRLSIYIYLLLPAVVSALQRAKELAMSMEMRAFRAMATRTSYYKLAMKGRDVLMLVGIAATTAAVGFVVWSH